MSFLRAAYGRGQMRTKKKAISNARSRKQTAGMSTRHTRAGEAGSRGTHSCRGETWRAAATHAGGSGRQAWMCSWSWWGRRTVHSARGRTRCGGCAAPASLFPFLPLARAPSAQPAPRGPRACTGRGSRSTRRGGCVSWHLLLLLLSAGGEPGEPGPARLSQVT